MQPRLRLRPTVAVSALIVIATAVFAVNVPVASAGVHDVVYRCGDNLCRIDSNGQNRVQLTTDGGPDPNHYANPSLSRDGARLVFRYQGKIYVAAANAGNRLEIDPGHFHSYATLRPDGGKVAVIRRTYGLYPGDISYYLYVANPDGSGLEHANTDAFTAGFLGDRVLSNEERNGRSALCVFTTGSSVRCERIVAEDPNADLWDPQVSPDLRWMSVTAFLSAADHRVGLWDLSTGGFSRWLTTGPQDNGGSWSADGSMIAFERSGSVYVMPASGGPGTERLLVEGREPTFGATRPDATGGDTTGRDVTAPLIKVGVVRGQHLRRALRRGLRVTVSASEPNRLSLSASVNRGTARKVRLLSRRSKRRSVEVGRISPAAGGAGKRIVTIKFTRKARKALRRQTKVRFTMKATARDAAGNIGRASRVISLRQ